MPYVVAASLFALTLSASPTLASDFGKLPSGEFPILYNDHTVYARPDLMKRGRVLAALVKDGQIYVPLRSMFEQMGATVSASPDGNTITAVKTDARVSVTVGKNVVVINGEERPLNVPPMLYRGVVLVPVRVISEALGAYVQWVSDKRVVVVRYLPPLAPALAPATPAPQVAPPAGAPIAPATTVPTIPRVVSPQRSHRSFIQAALAAPQNFNEFSAGQFCTESYLVSAAYAVKNSPFALKVDFRQDAYVTSDNLTDSSGNHFTRFATIDGGTAFTPVFLARQSTVDVRAEYQVAAPRIAVGLGYLQTNNNYGYPQVNAVGFGLEKLPDLRAGLNLFGSAFYYPSADGNYTITDPTSSNFGKVYRQQYQITKYDLGVALVWARSPLYLYGGFSDDRYGAGQNVPISQTHAGPYLGLGLKL